MPGSALLDLALHLAVGRLCLSLLPPGWPGYHDRREVGERLVRLDQIDVTGMTAGIGNHQIHRMGQQRPVAIDGEVVIRPMMYLALSYDHRIVDGKGAVTFLKRVKELIESPARMLLEV